MQAMTAQECKKRADKSLLVMRHKLKLSKHVHSFIHLLQTNLFTELQRNPSVQNAFLKKQCKQAFTFTVAEVRKDSDRNHASGASESGER